MLIGEAHHRLHQILLDEILIDAVDQRHIELDEVGLEIGDRAQSGVAAPGVVDGESVTFVAELLQAAAELGIILDRRSLGDLDDDLCRILHLQRVDSERGIGEIGRIDVHEEQLTILEQLAHTFDRALAA